MKRLCLYLVLLTLLSCKKTKNEELSFILLEDFTINNHTVIDGKKLHSYLENYIVKNFISSESNLAKLDSFACARYQAKTKNHHTFKINFYKYSKRTNVEELKKYERGLARYSDMHDKLYEYSVLMRRGRAYKMRYKMHKRSRVEKSAFICED